MTDEFVTTVKTRANKLAVHRRGKSMEKMLNLTRSPGSASQSYSETPLFPHQTSQSHKQQ